MVDGRTQAAIERGLTERQAQVLGLRDMGLSWTRIGEVAGCSSSTAQTHWKAAKRKLKQGTARPKASGVEKTVRDAAMRAGLAEEDSQALVSDLRDVFAGLAERAGALPASVEVQVYDDIRRRILASISDEDLRNANLSQKGILLGILFDKARLLRGEATSIVSIEDRRSLPDLMAALAKEARRRGITIDGELVREDQPERAVVAEGSG